MTRLPRLLAPVAALAVALAACTAGSSTTQPPATTGAGGGGTTSTDRISIGLVLEPTSLDFTTVNGAAIQQALMYNVYEGLVKVDDTGKVVPGLAKAWRVSDDRKTYTFDLVEGAKFANGEAFTAEDAVFTIDYVKTKWTNSLKNAMNVVAEAKALSPTQLQVTLNKPSNDWLYKMTTHMGAMMDPSGVAELATRPVGTGPYTLTSWTRGDSIVFTRNDNYWGAKPYYQTVTLRYIPDTSAMNNALLSGQINVIGAMQAPEALAQFTSNPKYEVIEGTTNGEVLLSFNNANEFFKDKRARLAIRHAIDHKALMDTCFAGKGTLLGSFVPPTDPWYEDLTSVTPYDKARATALLTESGRAGQTLRLRVPNIPYAVNCGQVVKSQLEQVGLKISFESLEFAQWLPQVFTGGDFDLSIVAHVEPRDMPAVFANPQYYTKYAAPAFVALIEAGDAGDDAAYVDNMKKAARMLAEDAAADVLFLLPNLMVTDRTVTGLPKNATSVGLDLSKLRKP